MPKGLGCAMCGRKLRAVCLGHLVSQPTGDENRLQRKTKSLGYLAQKPSPTTRTVKTGPTQLRELRSAKNSGCWSGVFS